MIVCFDRFDLGSIDHRLVTLMHGLRHCCHNINQFQPFWLALYSLSNFHTCPRYMPPFFSSSHSTISFDYTQWSFPQAPYTFWPTPHSPPPTFCTFPCTYWSHLPMIAICYWRTCRFSCRPFSFIAAKSLQQRVSCRWRCHRLGIRLSVWGGVWLWGWWGGGWCFAWVRVSWIVRLIAWDWESLVWGLLVVVSVCLWEVGFALIRCLVCVTNGLVCYKWTYGE